MSQLFLILTIIAMIAVLVSLFIGLIGMVRGGGFNEKHGNRMMRLRVGLQALALVLFVLAVLAR